MAKNHSTKETLLEKFQAIFPEVPEWLKFSNHVDYVNDLNKAESKDRIAGSNKNDQKTDEENIS